MMDATALPFLPSSVSDDQRQKMLQSVSSLGGTTQPQQGNRVQSVATAPQSSLPQSNGVLNRPDAPTFDPFSRPGDSWGDSGKRQQEYEGLLRAAGNESGFGGSKRASAKIAAAQGLMAPGLAQMQAQMDSYQNQMKGYDTAMLGGYGGSTPNTGGIHPMVMQGLAQMFGKLSNPAQPGTAPATATTTPATPAATTATTAPALPGVTPAATTDTASVLPETDNFGNSNALANNMNAQAEKMKKMRLSGTA